MNKGMQRYNSASSLIFRGSHIGMVTFLIGKRNIYWVIFTEQCLGSQLCLLEQIFKHGGQWQRAVAVVPGGGLAAKTLRCGCEDKFCRRPRLLQGIRIFHFRRKWHRLQNLLSIQACVCACVCVYVCIVITNSDTNQCTAHVVSVCGFVFPVLRLFPLNVVLPLVPACSLYLNSTTTTSCSKPPQLASSPPTPPKKHERKHRNESGRNAVSGVWIVNLFSGTSAEL